MKKCPNCGLDPQFCPCREFVTPRVTRRLGALLSLATLALVGCPPPGPVAPVQPPPGAPCERFCALLERDKCPGWNGSGGQDEVRGNSDDVPCVQVCVDTQTRGGYVADAACMDRTESCEVAEQCMFGP